MKRLKRLLFLFVAKTSISECLKLEDDPLCCHVTAMHLLSSKISIMEKKYHQTDKAMGIT